MERVLVLGLGISGLAASELLLRDGYDVTAVDRNSKDLELSPAALRLVELGMKIRDEGDVEDFSQYDKLIVSPGVSPDHPLYRQACSRGIEIVGEAQLALQRARQPCIGITGTNGKTTVTLLAEHILRSAGRKAQALGNVGRSLAAYFLAPDPEEIIVAELSSYQLETLHAPVLNSGIILNITPDHLDRYAGMHDYARAKCRLQLCMKAGGLLYVHAAAAREYCDLLLHEHLMTFGCDPDALFYTNCQYAENKGEKEPGLEYALPISFHGLGIHDSENALAAWLITRPFGISVEQFVQALGTFRKPAHRIEHIANINGVDYYDDSKGTNIDAVIKAVGAMQGQVILLAGGVDKGASYTLWKGPFAGKVKQIFAFGQAREKIAQEAGKFCQVQLVRDLEHAVHAAALVARKGECVLLSPGCSSFDMFRDYAHRGKEFERYVLDIQKEVTT